MAHEIIDSVIEEIECRNCGELVQYDAQLGVEVMVLQEPSMTSKPGRARIEVGGVLVQECDPVDACDEAVARQVGELLRKGRNDRL